MNLTVKDLTEALGAQQLSRELSVSSSGQPAGHQVDPQFAERVKSIVSKILSSQPQLGKIPVESLPGRNNAYYSFATDKINTGIADPDVIAHELGHAQNTQNAPIYQKLLTAVRGLSAINQALALPATLGMHAFLGNNQRHDLAATLAAVSAGLAAITTNEELSASTNAVLHSDDKLRTLKKMLPALGAHAMHDAAPAMIYSADQRI